MRMRHIITAAASVLLLAFSVPAQAQIPGIACGGLRGQQALVASLFFGRSVPGRAAVTAKEWQNFLARTVTPRFPDGLTVIDGNGQWVGRQGRRIVHEQTKIVVISVDRSTGDVSAILTKLDAIEAAYEQRFHQQKVGLVLTEGCASF